MTARAASVLVLAVAVSVASTSAEENWPQFRGPGGQGHSDATGVPLGWSETEHVTWKVAIPGRGWSSPVVLGEQVWMTTALETPASEEETRQRLEGNRLAPVLMVAHRLCLGAVCVDRETGKLLHDVELFQVERPDPINQMNSYASPTPFIEPGRLYCDFGTYGTACVDTATGQVLWKRRLPIDHQVGPGSSPLVYGDLLVLVRDGCDQQYVTALDKHTGQTVWRTDRPPIDVDYLPYKKAFSTPLVVEVEGRPQMIVPGAHRVIAYEPETGKPLWQVDYGNGYSNAPRPIAGHGMVYVCTGFVVPQLWAIRLGGQGNVSQTHVAWIERKQIPKRASPILVDDEIYVVSDSGILSCLDARTGHLHWRERMPGNYSASPIYVEGRIYFFSHEGKTTVIQPGRELTVLAESQLDGQIMATPAVADRAVFLRTDTHLYRIE